jgi:hypothetical protein
MSSRFAFLLWLPFSLVFFPQTPDPDADHIKEWTERHAHYLSEPRIKEADSWMEITANDPRPLDSILDALAHQHVWHINYEDPLYGNSDIPDDTAPSWLKEHPNGPRAYMVAGGAFHVKIPIEGYFPTDPMQVLPALIEAYNHSGDPGTFELRTLNRDSFDVVATASNDGPQTPLLDTVMSFDATEDESATDTLDRFCLELSRVSGETVVFTSWFSANRWRQAHIQLHSENQPAREILRQICKQVGSTYCWRLLYDPDSKKFWLAARS